MELWTIARGDLGLSDEAFYALTYRQLDALIRRMNFRMYQREWQTAHLIHAVYLNGMREWKQDTMPKAEQFILTKLKQEPVKAKDPETMTAEERQRVTDSIRSWVANARR